MITMNDDTDYVHTHIVNYEPTYLALLSAVAAWTSEGETLPLAECRDELRGHVEARYREAGLRPEDLTDGVDYAVMIQGEVENA